MSGALYCTSPLCTQTLLTAGKTNSSLFCGQIMADALTMWEELGKIDNTKVSLVLCLLANQ